MKFKLYTGKQSVQPSENEATYYLFMDLMRNYFEKEHVLYCDNYYCSPVYLWVLCTGATLQKGYLRQIDENSVE